ncbi:hypothetical protein BHE74_00053162 [Ensete ventricosum]|nr:hypothetical protein BHE74_00053162 [Ensete ventricosum]
MWHPIPVEFGAASHCRSLSHFVVLWFRMGEARDNDAYEEELLDYEEEEEKAPDSAAAKASGEAVKK